MNRQRAKWLLCCFFFSPLANFFLSSFRFNMKHVLFNVSRTNLGFVEVEPFKSNMIHMDSYVVCEINLVDFFLTSILFFLQITKKPLEDLVILGNDY